jgi:hypothetical protein
MKVNQRVFYKIVISFFPIGPTAECAHSPSVPVVTYLTFSIQLSVSANGISMVSAFTTSTKNNKCAGIQSLWTEWTEDVKDVKIHSRLTSRYSDNVLVRTCWSRTPYTF